MTPPVGPVVGAWRKARESRAQGFTLIEMVVTLTVAAILATVALVGVLAYAQTQQESSTAQAVLAALRSAAERAQSEGSTFCVYFQSPTEWTTWQYSCDPSETTTPHAPVQVGTGHVNGVGRVSLPVNVTEQPSGSSFASMCPTANQCVFFYPQGVATDGSVQVTRGNSSTTYTINVVGLTSRVYLS